MPPLSGLHHVTLPVLDLGAAVAWYGDILAAEHLPLYTVVPVLHGETA